jgi:hypothetical protein
MISDISNFERGWLWQGWSIIAIGWAIGIIALMIANVARSLRVYIRNRRANRSE